MEAKSYRPAVDWEARVAVNMLNEMVANYLKELDLDEAAESFMKRLNEGRINLSRSFPAREWQRFYLYYRSCTPAEILSMHEFPCSPLEYHDLNSLVRSYLKDLRLTREAALFESRTPSDNSVDYDSFNSIRWWIFPYSARIASIPSRKTRKTFALPSTKDPSVTPATEDPPLKAPQPRIQTCEELLEDQIRIRDDVLKMLSSMKVLQMPQTDKSEKPLPSEGKTMASSELGLERVMPEPTAHQSKKPHATYARIITLPDIGREILQKLQPDKSEKPLPSEGKTVATSELGLESVMPEPTAHKQSEKPPPSNGGIVPKPNLGLEIVLMPQPDKSEKPLPSEGKTVATSGNGLEIVMPEPKVHKQSEKPPPSNGRIVPEPNLGLEIVLMPQPDKSEKPLSSEGKTVATSGNGLESVMPEPKVLKQHEPKNPPRSYDRIVALPDLGLEIVQKLQPDKSEKPLPSEGKTVATSELSLESVMPEPTAQKQHQSNGRAVSIPGLEIVTPSLVVLQKLEGSTSKEGGDDVDREN